MNTIGWGEAAKNNLLDWGKCRKNNQLGFARIYAYSYRGETVMY